MSDSCQTGVGDVSETCRTLSEATTYEWRSALAVTLTLAGVGVAVVSREIAARAALAIGAAYLPARRAIAVNPIAALRQN